MMTTFYPPCSFGGDGIFVENLSHQLADRGHHVTVVHCVDTYRLLTGGEPPGDYTAHPKIEIVGLRSRAGFLSPLITQQTGRLGLKAGKIRRILDCGFDVINFHNISLVGGPGLLSLAQALSGTAIKLYTLHEYWLVCPTHTLFKFQRRACDGRRCFLCALSYRRPPQLWRHTHLVQRAVRHVDAFIAPDRFSAAKHREMGLEIPARYIPHFVPPDNPGPEPPAELPAAARMQSYFLFVGRLERLKGVQTLIPVFGRLPHARLLIAGTGEYEDQLRRQAAPLDNVVFLGHCNGAVLRALYRHATAVVVPSINYEVAPPLVIIEAFRESTPVIVRNLGANPEPVQDSGGGFVYNNEEELVHALNHLATETGHSRELGRRGREMIDREWSPDVYLRRYFALIEELEGHRQNKDIPQIETSRHQ